MDIKDLNKSQLILLAVLLSFVTSIATGITTVTLMQQAPVSFTAPINRVIKETVEKIVPVPGKNTVQTVVIKEEDLVVDAIAKNSTAVFAISKRGDDGIELSLGSGFTINANGVIVVDALWVPAEDRYFVTNKSGKFKSEFLFTEKEKGFSFLKIGDPVDGQSKVAYTVPTFGDISTMKTGQKILVLGETIFSFIFDSNKDIKINSGRSGAGGLVLNLEGEALGIALSSDVHSFVPINVINEYFVADTSN